MPISYKEAGVDVERGYRAVELMKQHTKKTLNENVLGDIGSFGGFYSLASEKMSEPVLVSGTDGVGTKLKYAILADKHNTIGIDAVAMCVNDIVCSGARPLFFLDYIASSKIEPEKIASIVEGISSGCEKSGAALLGGETAEMPGFYKDGDYDIAGFAVGIVDKKKIIDGKNITAGDTLIGLKSSGLHSNGYSLVRKLFGENKKKLDKIVLKSGKLFLDEALTPTKIYVKTILSLIEKFIIKGIANITGGGFVENIPRILPEWVGCEIDTKAIELPEIFALLQEKSGLDNQAMYNTFNMGIGMVLCVAPGEVDAIMAELGDRAAVIGKTVSGDSVCLK